MAEQGWEETNRRLKRLEAQMGAVLGRLERLEAARREAEPRLVETKARPDVEAPPVVWEAPPPAQEPLSRRPAVPKPEPSASRGGWEALIGRTGMLWAGTLLVFLAVAFLLVVTWRTLGPAGRLAVGVGCAFALLGLGEAARPRVHQGFGEGLCGGGLAVLYLNAWAVTARYHMLPLDAALTLMVAATGLGVVLAVRYDCMSLHALASIGGFLTPALAPASGNHGSPVPFLAYVAVLNGGILVVALLKAWRPVVGLSLVSTVLLVGGWLQGHFQPPDRWVVLSFLTVYFLLFAAAAAFRGYAQKEADTEEDALLLSAAALSYFGAAYGVTLGALGGFPAILPLTLCAFLGIFSAALRHDDPLMRFTSGGLALLFLTLSAPIQWKQGWVSVAWSVEATALATLGTATDGTLLRRAGQVVWVLAMLSVLSVLSTVQPRSGLLFVNERALPLLAGALASAGIAACVSVRKASDELRPLYGAAATLGGAWLVGQETLYGLETGDMPWPAAWRAYGTEGYALAIAVAVYALAAYAVGIRVRDAVVRGFSLSTALVATLICMGTSGLTTEAVYPAVWNPRLLAYLASAAAMAGIAWMASREGEGLNEPETDAAGYLPLAVHLAAMAAVSAEVWAAFSAASPAYWEPLASLAIAAFVCLYAVALAYVGWAGVRPDQRCLAYVTSAFGAWLVLGSAASLPASVLPGWNLRLMAYACATLSAGALAGLAAARPLGAGMERHVPAAGAGAACSMALWGLTQETWGAFQYYHEAIGPNWRFWAQSSISLVWTAFASGLLITGLRKDLRAVRYGGLGLFGVTLAKVTLYDLAALETQYRILSTAVLGVALIGMSWLYSNQSANRPAGGAPLAHGT